MVSNIYILGGGLTLLDSEEMQIGNGERERGQRGVEDVQQKLSTGIKPATSLIVGT